MFDKMKYIVIDDGMIATPIVFSSHMTHSVVASHLRGEVVSAGFVSLSGNKLHCWGESVSLNVSSRSEDTELLVKMLGGYDE